MVRLAPTRLVHIWGMHYTLRPSCCRLQPLGGSQGSAEEEEKTAQITVWSDRFEIFLEHRLIVVNTPTKFITHVTDLMTLEPRREGPLTFILRRGSEEPTTPHRAHPRTRWHLYPRAHLPEVGRVDHLPPHSLCRTGVCR